MENWAHTTRNRKYSNLSYIHNVGTEPLRSLTLGKLLEQSAKKYGDRKAIISRAQNQTLTFREVLEQADKFAAGLTKIGVNIGDRVGIWAPNIIEWYITDMACARGGFILVNLNPAYQVSEIQYCINKVGLKSIVCPDKFKKQNYYDILNEASDSISKSEPGRIKCKNMPTLESVIICSDKSLRGTFNYQEIIGFATEAGIQNISTIQDEIDPDDAGHIQFTSGTTGQPKAAIQTHFNMVNNSYFIGKRMELSKKHHTICVQNPFFHGFGTNITINAALNHGATIVVPAPGYDPKKSLEAIRDEKCTMIHGTPTMYVDLVNVQKNRNENINPEIALTGGATCSPHLFKEMKEMLNLKKVKSVFGLTETTAVSFQSLEDDDEYKSTATVGYVGEHLEVKVVDEKGRIVPRGVPGELYIRGYNITNGYWQDDEGTKALIGADRWLRTGDQFVLEEDGYGRIIGRLKEMLIRGGENIVPREIEDVLNTHPDILETHVIGLPHERLGEEVCAVIRLKENASLTLDNLKLYCKGKIAHFKIPSVLKIVQSFPKTTSGKIQKYKIVEALKSRN